MSRKSMGGRLLASALLMLAGWPARSQNFVIRKAPLSPRYQTWLAKGKPRGVPGAGGGTKEGGQRIRGFIPAPMDLSHVHGPIFSADLADTVFPDFYDLRATGMVTPVKDQGQYGTCWTFACTGSLESSLLKAGTGVFDLSEWDLAYFAYVPFNHSLLTAFTPGPAQYGEDPIFDQGGNDWMSTAILARGTGAVNEKACPYQPGYYRPEPRPAGDLPNGKEETSVQLKRALYLFNSDSPSNAADLKYAITHFGPAVISMDWEDQYFDVDQNTYRDTVATEFDLNHEVCIVGWNDHFETCRFPKSNRPAHPGAWIVRNSWSRNWGHGGYFYLSYDSPMFDGTVFLGAQETSHRIHQYDPLGWCDSIGLGTDTATCANVFQAGDEEKITAVSFYAGTAGTSYEIDVRPGITGDPGTGFIGLAPQQGSFRAPGYHTVRMANPVTVAKGGSFAVVVKLTTPGYVYPVPVQDLIEGYSESSVSEHGRSFVSPDGVTWRDLSPDCTGPIVCVKALAETVD